MAWYILPPSIVHTRFSQCVLTTVVADDSSDDGDGEPLAEEAEGENIRDNDNRRRREEGEALEERDNDIRDGEALEEEEEEEEEEELFEPSPPAPSLPPP
jgi:hypothetical protein